MKQSINLSYNTICDTVYTTLLINKNNMQYVSLYDNYDCNRPNKNTWTKYLNYMLQKIRD